MVETKFIYSGGLAFTEQKDMDRLRELAKEGWLLERMQLIGYVLRKAEPKELDYALDYQKNPDDEYISFFEMSGWTHVCSVGNEIHIFSAPTGTTPIHTDKMTTVEKYKTQKRYMGKIALPTLLFTLLLIAVARLGENGWVPGVIGDISILMGYLSMIVLIFTGMPYIGYSFKLRKLRKG